MDDHLPEPRDAVADRWAATLFKAERRTGFVSVRRPWGTVSVRYGAVSAQGRRREVLIHRRSTTVPLRRTIDYPGAELGRPAAVAIAFLASLGLAGQALGGGSHWLFILVCGMVGALLMLGAQRAIHRAVQADSQRVVAGSALESLLLLDLHGRDEGLFAALVDAGWSWQQLDDPEVLALVRSAASVLRQAAVLRVPEVAAEVPGLVAGCRTPEDVRAAQVVTDRLATKLAALADANAAREREASAPVEAARRQLQAERADAALARAQASVRASEEAIDLSVRASLPDAVPAAPEAPGSTSAGPSR